MQKSPRASAILLFLCAALAVAQRSASRNVAFDPSARFTGLKSYAWFDDPKWVMPKGNAVVDGQFIDRTVRAAVNASLGRKGFAKVEGGASFSVSYLWSDAGGRSQGKWGSESWWGVTIAPTTFEMGSVTPVAQDPTSAGDVVTQYRRQSTLVLEIRDGHGKVVWRGARTAATGSNPQDLARGIDHAVGKLLAQFPPKTGAEAK